MNERQTGEGRQDRWSQGERQSEGEGGSQRGMTTTPQGSGEMEGQGDRSQGNWTGYVVPYRYYGPGYRGVGYYSVMYQGRGDDDAPDADAQGVGQHYGQGTGAGGGWEPESDTNGWRGAGQRGSWRGASAGGWNRSTGTGGWSGGRAGRGPKGYQRSDDRLREDVSDMLMADDQLDASEIEV